MPRPKDPGSHILLVLMIMRLISFETFAIAHRSVVQVSSAGFVTKRTREVLAFAENYSMLKVGIQAIVVGCLLLL
jgi:hypothetical protein